MNNGGAELNFQWMAGSTQVSDTNSYQIQASDAGKTITLTVSGTDNYSGDITPVTTAVVPYMIVVGAYNQNGDSVAAQTFYSVSGTVTIHYTLKKPAILNEVRFFYATDKTAVVGTPKADGSATSVDYTVNPVHAANGVITLTPAVTHDSTMSAANVSVVPPVMNVAADTNAIDTAYYTGTIAWQTSGSPHSGSFAADTVYTATVTLTAKPAAYTKFTGNFAPNQRH